MGRVSVRYLHESFRTNRHCFKRQRRVPKNKEMDMVNTNANVMVVVNGPPALWQYYDRYYYCCCRFGENVSERRYHAATDDIVYTIVRLSLRIIVDFSANNGKGEREKRDAVIFHFLHAIRMLFTTTVPPTRDVFLFTRKINNDKLYAARTYHQNETDLLRRTRDG